MKKTTKAAIAGGLGVVLLAGGAGSLAFWTAEAEGPEAVIQSGQLTFGDMDDVDSTWMIEQSADGVDPAQTVSVPFDPSAEKIVPGDVLTNTVSVPVNLAGKNIKAKFAVDSEFTEGGGASGVDLAALLDDVRVVIDAPDGVLTEGDTAVEVTITITFPWGVAGDYNELMNSNVTFTSDYTLTQIAFGPTP